MKVFFYTLLGSVLLAGIAHADGAGPVCMDHGRVLNIDNDAAIKMKHTTPNEHHSRAHVAGTLTDIFPDATGHHHIELTMIGSSGPDTIELIYNEQFGATPPLQKGQSLEGCGDYITSNAPYEQLPASPDGAILHWLHRSDEASHDSGFIIVNGTVVGL